MLQKLCQMLNSFPYRFSEDNKYNKYTHCSRSAMISCSLVSVNVLDILQGYLIVWHWGAHRLSREPVGRSWRIWVDHLHDSFSNNTNYHTIKQILDTLKPYAYYREYTVCYLIYSLFPTQTGVLGTIESPVIEVTNKPTTVRMNQCCSTNL